MRAVPRRSFLKRALAAGTAAAMPYVIPEEVSTITATPQPPIPSLPPSR